MSGSRTLMRDDTGAYLVLYALLATAVLGILAVVVDLAALRQGRRADRTAADLASTAGAGTLDPLDPATAAVACQTAWDYVVLNVEDAGGTTTPPSCAAAFPGAPCDPASPVTVTGQHGPLDVSITHPVPDGHDLMRSEIQGGDAAQPADATRDGNACERLGVRIERSRTFLLGGITGTFGGSTDVHAVARRAIGPSTDYPAVVALEPTGCNAVDASAVALQIVPGAGLAPDTLVVDTDLSACGGGHAIVATAAGGVTAGEVEAFALSGPNGARTATGSVIPAPVPVTTRLGRGFLDRRYNCGPPCAEPIGKIDDLRQRYGTALVPPGFTRYTTCTVGPADDVRVDGDVYVDCPRFLVEGKATFTGRTIVFGGAVEVAPNGCLAINDSACRLLSVPSPRRAVTTVVLGMMLKQDRGVLVAANTFVYAEGGLNLPRWPNDPLAQSRVTWTAPLDGDFEDLLVWTEVSTDVVLGEQRIQTYEGTVAAPNANVVLETTQAGVTAYATQVVARAVTARGADPAVVSPLAGRATGRVARQVKLIR